VFGAEKLSLTLTAGSPVFQDGMLPVQMAAEAPSSFTTGQVSGDKRRSERQKENKESQTDL
jgi:hypothetical protein